MSYLVLARKWRPQRFEDMVGQKAAVRTLQNAISRGRIAHAMIFSGVRGVGKTTLARLMAKAINCEDGDPPCNRCRACTEITTGSALDLHEIDGASNRGIQEIRDLKENIRFLPTSLRYKVYIIDEVHMLTTEAFNALLKTLEEPPAHVYFMFATTELHKVPVTILSRCQRYELQRIAFAELTSFFRKVAEAEGVRISERALEMIAREASGSVRDGLSLLDQIFSFGGEDISEREITEVLGLIDEELFGELCAALLEGHLERCLPIIDRSSRAGVDLKRLARDLLDYFRAVVVAKTCSNEAGGLLDYSDREVEGIRRLADSFTAETLYRYFQMLFKGVEEMQHASQPRLALEMVCLRICQAGRVTPVAELLGRVDGLLQQVGGALPEGAAPSEPGRVPSAADGRDRATVVAEKPAPPAPPKESAKKVEKPETEAPSAAAIEAAARPPKDILRNWDEFTAYVKERKIWMAQALKLGAAHPEKDSLVLVYDDLSDCRVLREQDNLKALTEFAQDFFQKELAVRIVVKGEGEAVRAPDQPQEERRALANDPLVQLAAEVFGAQVTGIRTGPRSR
ncbi:MAG: DNA polymerase III subunit gamma/tau [Thermodesulfobacteriota bacterium]